MQSPDFDEDIFQHLPVLKSSSLSQRPIFSEFLPTWFDKYSNEVRDDADPMDFHKLIIDHLVHNGFKEVAYLLCEDANIPLPAIDDCDNYWITLDDRDAIRKAVSVGDIEHAINLVNKLAPGLLAANERLHFNLLRQKLVEIIRQGDVEAAMNFAEHHNLSAICERQSLRQVKKLEMTYALLAFNRPAESPFDVVMKIEQRIMLAADLNETIFAHLSIHPTTSRLENLLRLLLFHAYRWDIGKLSRPLDSYLTSIMARELFASEGDAVYDFSVQDISTD